MSVQDDEEDTSIFNMGIALDAAGTDAVFNFGPNPGPTAGSTFTTHQQQQAEQELAEKRMSQMQLTDLSAAPQRGTIGASDMVSIHPDMHFCCVNDSKQNMNC